jgi:hypothetical protein
MERADFFSGIRMTIFRKTDRSMGGISEKSMSVSFMRRSRCQSVPDFFCIDILFMSTCLTGGDDSNDVGGWLGEDNHRKDIA